MVVRGDEMKLEIGPNGELRPVDPNQRAAMIVKLATGQIKESCEESTSSSRKLGSGGAEGNRTLKS